MCRQSRCRLAQAVGRYPLVDDMPHTNGAKGLMDSIAIYSKALTLKEIKCDMGVTLAVDARTKLAQTWADIKNQ